MIENISCLIPFYNEGSRLEKTLSIISKVPEINDIVCVDDGSTDEVHNYIGQLFPNINLIRQETNQGKTAAIARGIYYVRNQYVLLLDADLEDLDAKEISKTIIRLGQGDIDGIILGRRSSNWFVRLNRGDVIFSGQRLLSKEDIQGTLSLKPIGYQLEIAMNMFLRKNKRRVGVVKTTSFTNTYKFKKWGVINGLKRELSMAGSLIRFAGLREYLLQVLTFGKKEIQI